MYYDKIMRVTKEPKLPLVLGVPVIYEWQSSCVAIVEDYRQTGQRIKY